MIPREKCGRIVENIASLAGQNMPARQTFGAHYLSSIDTKSFYMGLKRFRCLLQVLELKKLKSYAIMRKNLVDVRFLVMSGFLCHAV